MHGILEFLHRRMLVLHRFWEVVGVTYVGRHLFVTQSFVDVLNPRKVALGDEILSSAVGTAVRKEEETGQSIASKAKIFRPMKPPR